MRPLATAELLAAWEQGSTASASTRTFALLAAACPELSLQAVTNLSVGQRDARLLKLREWTFGSQLLSVANCTACGERLEWSVSTTDLLVDNDGAFPGEMTLEVGAYAVRFRLPTSADLGVISAKEDLATCQMALLERCVLEARLEDREIAVDQLGPEATEAIARRMAEVDPQADVQFNLSCPTCGHVWQALLDIENFFWTELNAWARKILSEVHILASAYGWREADILGLSPLRRQYYLGLVSG